MDDTLADRTALDQFERAVAACHEAATEYLEKSRDMLVIHPTGFDTAVLSPQLDKLSMCGDVAEKARVAVAMESMSRRSRARVRGNDELPTYEQATGDPTSHDEKYFQDVRAAHEKYSRIRNCWTLIVVLQKLLDFALWASRMAKRLDDLIKIPSRIIAWFRNSWKHFIDPLDDQGVEVNLPVSGVHPGYSAVGE